MSRFVELLQGVGKIFHLPLHVDRMNACSIRIHDQLVIQLQPDLAFENLWIFSKLIEIPPGKFRENVLREALKANGEPDPRIGYFGYLANTNHLSLFQKYPLDLLNADNLSGIIGSFVEMAIKWQSAIANGRAGAE